jgi:hypothetical protein
LWVEVNEKRYRKENLNLDWNSDYCGLAYDAFLEFKRVFIKNGSHMFIKKIFKVIIQ